MQRGIRGWMYVVARLVDGFGDLPLFAMRGIERGCEVRPNSARFGGCEYLGGKG